MIAPPMEHCVPAAQQTTTLMEHPVHSATLCSTNSAIFVLKTVKSVSAATLDTTSIQFLADAV
jgi:hypothetical protein